MLTPEQRQQLRDIPAYAAPNRIRAAMNLSGVTQEQIAAAFGIRQGYISRIVNGFYSKLPLETARQYADFFGCSIEELFPATAHERVSA